MPSAAIVFYTAVPEAAPAAALSTSAAPAAALSTSAAPAAPPPPKAHVARYASWLRGPAAPRVASSDEAAVVAALRKREPIVVENSSLTKSLRHWTFQYLADHSDGDVPRFHTHFAPKRRRVFPRKYGKKLMPGEAAAEEGGIVATTFRDFHELLGRMAGGDGPPPASPARADQVVPALNFSPSPRGDLGDVPEEGSYHEPDSSEEDLSPLVSPNAQTHGLLS